ncbi:MAG: hypothetical protein Ct9H300mP1_04390 [Planctomycetaceae bacterium]|nr:MAG: hypothetical protein Ct9H300mP1_04390 [Planctomycetaceae bacterium]
MGLVGGIGSGKSALARWVSRNSPVEVLDGTNSDTRRSPSPHPGLGFLERFPQAGPSDTSSRPKSAAPPGGDLFWRRPRIAIGSERPRSHRPPFIRRSLEDLTQKTPKPNRLEGILVDAAYCWGPGWDDLCDHVVFVDVPEADRRARVTSTRNWTRSDFLARQSSQWSLERKQARSDTIIDNSKTLETPGPPCCQSSTPSAARPPRPAHNPFRHISSRDSPMSTPSPTPPDATVDNPPATGVSGRRAYEEIKQSDMHIADLQRKDHEGTARPGPEEEVSDYSGPKSRT